MKAKEVTMESRVQTLLEKELATYSAFTDDDGHKYYMVLVKNGAVTTKHKITQEEGEPHCTCNEFRDTGDVTCVGLECLKVLLHQSNTMKEKETTTTSTTPASSGSVLDKLRAPVPANQIKTRDFSWGSAQYVEWTTVAEILDNVVGLGWGWEIVDLTVGSTAAICRGRLTVNGVSRDGVGASAVIYSQGKPKQDAFEQAAKGAASDALKRAAVMFGIGRDLYVPVDDHHQGNQQQHPQRTVGRNQPAQGQQQRSSGGRPASDKQVSYIDRLANDQGLDADAESRRYFGVPTDVLTSAEASDLIKHLQGELVLEEVPAKIDLDTPVHNEPSRTPPPAPKPRGGSSDIPF